MRGCGEGKQCGRYILFILVRKNARGTRRCERNVRPVDYIPQLFKRNEGYSVSPGEIRILSRVNEIIRSLWKENNFELMILLLSLSLSPVRCEWITCCAFAGCVLARSKKFTRETLKLNSQKRNAKSRGDDVARIITVFRAGTLVISHNWSSFRAGVANWNLFILIFSSSGTKSHVRTKRGIWIGRRRQRGRVAKKGEIKGVFISLGLKFSLRKMRYTKARLNEILNLSNLFQKHYVKIESYKLNGK